MTRIVKYFIYLILFLILLIGALIALVVSIDPSRLKPTLERELGKQGIEANFEGDISWRFYPSIGLSVETLSLNPENLAGAEPPLVYVDSMAFSVRLMPLLQREILVDGIRVNSARLNLVVDENGSGNWEAFGGGETDEQAPEPVEPAQQATLPEIQIDELSLSGLSLNYSNRQTGENFAVENLSVEATNFNLEGSPFPLNLTISAALPDLPPISADLSSLITLNMADKVLSFKDANLQINPLTGSNQSIGFAFNGRVNWQEPLNITTSINSSEFNPRKLLEDFELATIPTQNPQALSAATIAFDLSYSPEQIAVTNIKAVLDSTHIEGNTTLTATDNSQVPWRIESRWSGDRINVDDYLPPPEEGAPETAVSEPQPLPSETIRSLNAFLGVAFDEVIAMEAPIQNVELEVQASEGVITLDKMDAQAFDGNISAQGTFDASMDTVSLALTLNADSIDVGQLAEHFAELDILAGDANTEVLVTAQGQTDQELMNSLVAETEISSQSLKVSPINLEQQYCKLLATLDKRELTNSNWNAFTELQPVTITARYAADLVTLASMDAAIEKLSAQASGTLNLESGRFDFPFEISLADFSSGPDACGKISEKWRKRAIPLRCKGNLSDIGADTCLPDTDRIGDMVKAAAEEKVEAKKQELQQKADTKVEEKKDEIEGKAKSKLEEELERLKKKGLFK